MLAIDSKQHRGHLQLDPTGRLWHGRHPLTPTLRAVSFEADQAAQVLPTPTWPWSRSWPSTAPRSLGQDKVVTHGVPVTPATRLPSMLRQLPAALGSEGVAKLAGEARLRFRAAA